MGLKYCLLNVQFSLVKQTFTESALVLDYFS